MFQVVTGPPAERFLKKADELIRERIAVRVRELAADPFPKDCKRVLSRKEKTFRVRVGTYRIL